MKRTFFFPLLLLGTIILAASVFAADPVPSVTAPSSTTPPPDVDKLAARMSRDGDLYAFLRDQSLATYAKLHPTASAYDPQAKTAIRLAAYLRVWGDFYGEGLWPMALDQARQAINAGSTDPLLLNLQTIHTMESVKSSDDYLAAQIDQKANAFAATAYPHAFKLWLFTLDARNLVGTKISHQLKDTTAAQLPKAIESAVNEYDELLKARVSSDFLAVAGEALYHALQPDEESLKLAGLRINQAFVREDPTSVLFDAMQGQYFITWAWNARGVGYVNTVTANGFEQFSGRLQKAAEILGVAYTKHPEAGMVSREMLTVELGQGNDRLEMDLWFGRAIKANPDDYAAYMAKAYYLTPQWHGSDDDLWKFGVECSQSQNWSGKVPLVLVDLTVSYLWKKHPEGFTDPTRWAVYQGVFHGYLEHFPDSTRYRSIYARWATESGHFAEAAEQFKILGDNWDREVFPGGRYEEMRGKADAGAQAASPVPAAK